MASDLCEFNGAAFKHEKSTKAAMKYMFINPHKLVFNSRLQVKKKCLIALDNKETIFPNWFVFEGWGRGTINSCQLFSSYTTDLSENYDVFIFSL